MGAGLRGKRKRGGGKRREVEERGATGEQPGWSFLVSGFQAEPFALSKRELVSPCSYLTPWHSPSYTHSLSSFPECERNKCSLGGKNEEIKILPSKNNQLSTLCISSQIFFHVSKYTILKIKLPHTIMYCFLLFSHLIISCGSLSVFISAHLRHCSWWYVIW